ncbi:MAG: peptidylprolyl isomerase [Planctomycetaceae bacterium]|nr:peptidylprolyl isomerase [Planctomycetaceae bacterium]
MMSLRGRRSQKRFKGAQAAAADCIQTLEERALLTGNVIASLNGPHLSVTGDAAGNQLEVSVVNNQVILRGLTNTTINGSTALFVIAANTDTAPGNITIETGAGNDTVIFSRDVKVAGSTWLDGGTGNDTLSVDGATFQQTISIYGRDGDDTISVQNATTEGLLRIKGKAGDDLISVTNLTANGEIRIEGNRGNDGVSLNNVITKGYTKIKTGTGDDNIVIRNSTLGGTLRIRTEQNSDMLLMDSNTANAPVAINMGRDSDSVQLRNTNTFNSWFHVQAGDGNADAVDPGTTTVFKAGRRVRKSEGSTVNTTQTDRIDNATTGLIARATAADAAAASLITLDLTLNNSANTTESSVGGVLITRDADFVVAGSTLPGATVTLDTNNDGIFDNGTLTADNLGHFSTTVTLQRTDLNTATAANDQLNGLNKIKVRSTLTGVGTRDVELNVDYVPATDKIVRFTTNEGTYEVELFNGLTPNTAANFLSYTSRYTDAIVQRSVSNFVIQVGRYTVGDNQLAEITKDANINNEFNSQTSNIRGTLSMATPGNNINGGSSEWFINTNDNSSNLDAVPHTVFGRVIGNGMTVVDKIAALTVTDLSAATGIGNSTDGPLNTVPFRVPFVATSKALTGTVSTTANSTTITGVGTKFLTELHGNIPSLGASTGSRISIGSETYRVLSIQSDTSLTLDTTPTSPVTPRVPTTTLTGQAAKTDDFADDNFVRFSSIAEILSI